MSYNAILGDLSEVVRPDPIPNSVVKRFSGDDNSGASRSENTSLPGFFFGLFATPRISYESLRSKKSSSTTLYNLHFKFSGAILKLMVKKSAQKVYPERSRRGFTLVELLVVITIIAILATIGLTVYSSAQKNARIAKRIGDLKAIQTALEIYYSVNKSYPVTGYGVWRSECYDVAPDQVIPGLVPTYMPAFPADPSMNKTADTSCYVYSGRDTDYKLLDTNISEFTAADYLSQKNLVDFLRDGDGDRCTGNGVNPWAWSVYSSCPSPCSPGPGQPGSCWW